MPQLLRRFALASLAFLLPLTSPAHALAAETGGAAGEMAAFQPALLEVTLNGQPSAEPGEFLRRAGRLYVAESALRQWRLRIPVGGAIRQDGQAFYPAEALTGVSFSVSEESQAVAVTAGAAAFEAQTATLGEELSIPMTPSGTGAFLNYDLFADYVGGRLSAAGAFEAGLFTPSGAGVATFVASAGGGRTRLTRLETNWTIDRPESMTSIRIGDAISAAGPGAAPVRFAGLQFARNFATRPGFYTMPLPVANGSAALPSVVDVYVNSTLQTQQQVAPGPFALSNVPVASGGGTVQLVVRDLLGREIISEQSYYASTQALRRGLHDFSYEIGALREDFGKRSNRYGSLFASTSHRYGISNHVTIEATAQASRRLQMAGVAFIATPFDLGQIGGSLAISHSRRGTGLRAAASLERRTPAFSVGALADYSNRAFATLGQSEDKPLPRFTLQAFADLSLGRGGVGVNFLHRDMRGAPDETLIGLFASWRLGAGAQLQAFARHSIVGARRTSIGVNLAFALGGRRSASASLDGSRREQAATFSYQNDAPAGPGQGYRATVRLGEGGGAEASYVRNLTSASLTVQASYARRQAGLRLSAAGGVGWLEGRLFAARSLGQSFAAVRVEGLPGVRIYADNQPVGRTGHDGALIVPGLRAFEGNAIRIEQGDLPLDVQLDREEIVIRPFARAGTVIGFPVRRERGALLRIRLEGGEDLPAGARVRIEGRPEHYVAVSGGMVYVPGLAGAARLTADWAGGRCGTVVIVPGGDDPQPRIDGLTCARSASYATR